MEMYSIGAAYEILEDGNSAPAGYTKVSGHLIWSEKWTLQERQDGCWMATKYLIELVLSMQCSFNRMHLNCIPLCSPKWT